MTYLCFPFIYFEYVSTGRHRLHGGRISVCFVHSLWEQGLSQYNFLNKEKNKYTFKGFWFSNFGVYKDLLETRLIKKFNMLGFIKIKSFSESKDTFEKMKRQPSEWDKLFANHTSDKGLVERTPRLNNKQINDPFLRWTKDLKR